MTCPLELEKILTVSGKAWDLPYVRDIEFEIAKFVENLSAQQVKHDRYLSACCGSFDRSYEVSV